MKFLTKIVLIILIVGATSCASDDASKNVASEVAKVEPVEEHKSGPVAPVVLPVEEPVVIAAPIEKIDVPEGVMPKPPKLEIEEELEKAELEDWNSETGSDEIVDPVVINEPRVGKLAVYCPHQMTYKQSSDVIGFIADLIDDDLIKDMISGRVSELLEEDDFTAGEEDFLIKELEYFNRIELRLNDADNEGFTIKKVHEDDLQLISENMEGWHWKVTPTTNDSKQQLVLKVIVYDSEGNKKTSFNKTYHINIKIESRMFWRNAFTLFVENQEWAFASIITPVGTFIAGRYNGRRKKKKGKGKDKSA